MLFDDVTRQDGDPRWLGILTSSSGSGYNRATDAGRVCKIMMVVVAGDYPAITPPPLALTIYRWEIVLPARPAQGMAR